MGWRIAVAGWLLVFALEAGAEVKEAVPQGFTIENARTVAADPATTWRALVHDIDRWWPKDHSWWGDASTLSIEPRAGGCFCERDGARQARHMAVVFVEPDKLLRMVGGLGPLQGMGLGGAMEWRLEPVASGTRVTWWYRAGGYTPDDLTSFAAIVDKVQARQLQGLADFLGKMEGAGTSEDEPAP
ncbi:SRPBCC family protein [Luteimonas vadosa]|uniref:SRPBCC family protein n=1 Tax=Luteimonas vadosa TaxID=1165507 RepID=A0ABP9E3S3_9GAMM